MVFQRLYQAAWRLFTRKNDQARDVFALQPPPSPPFVPPPPRPPRPKKKEKKEKRRRRRRNNAQPRTLRR
jgi:hypothetical protein